jgi:biopolymer transport protein ExbB/TolQ
MNNIIIAIQDGGMWMAPIILAFVFALAIAAERFFYLMSATSNGKAVMDTANGAIMSGSTSGQATQQLGALAGKKQVLPTVLHAGLRALNRSDKEIEAALEEATLTQFPLLMKRMTVLPMLANVATLSGLLGTIVGLIEAFDAVANAAPDQKQIMLAKGISKAMYTTAGGLVVAIPTLIMNSILSAKITGIMDEVDQKAAEFLNRVRATRRKGSGEAAK